MKKAIVSFVVGSALVFSQTGDLWSQTHKVASKPETVVRAVGVYEWTGDLSKPTGSRFVPVTVFIDGELEDAGIYKPQPVPFALLAGNIYELDEAGLSKGTLTLESALRAVTPDGAPSPAFDEGWTAYGSYQAPAAAKRSAPLKASKTLPVIQTSGGDSNRPHFGNKSGDAAGKSTDSGQQASKPDTGTSAKDSPPPAADDPDRPTMHRRTVDDTASTADTASTETGSTVNNGKTSSDDDPERPTLKRRSPEEEKQRQQQNKKKDAASVTGNGSLNDDPDRPRLHHGGSGSDADRDTPKLMGVPKDMHQMVAVSDAKNRDPHALARPWEDPNERAGVLAKMQAFARTKLAEYGVVPGVTPPTAIAGTTATGSTSTTATAPDSGPPSLKRGIPSKTTTTASPSTTAAATGTAPDGGPPTLKRGVPPKASVTTETAAAPAAKTSPTAKAKTSTASTSAKTRHKAAAGPAPVVLADEDLRGYTLSYGGSATYVYMAHTVETGSVMRYVTIVAQTDAMGDLKLVLASATDAAHLDHTPWMRLVDAVDVEASNRASLLFEMRGQSSRQFALYRVIAAKPEQIFLTGSS